MESLLGLPPVASAHGAELDAVMVYVHWLMAVMFVLWTGLFLYMLFRFRARKNPRADHDGFQGKAPKWIEVGVIVAELILLIGFSIPLWSDRVDDFPDEREAVRVRVVGEQFAWNIHYPGPDGVFGPTLPELVDLQNNPLGLDRNDPTAKDDITTVNQLHLPVDKPALIYLTSKDVIHSFMLNEFRVKQDAVPGIMTPVWFEPTVTTEEMKRITGKDAFTYEISCAQLCGLGHATMRGFVTIEEPAEFEAWLESKAPSEEADSIWN
jgi:cytochrome c oxidase subunit 2